MGKNLVADHLVQNKNLVGSSLDNIIFTHPKKSVVIHLFFFWSRFGQYELYPFCISMTVVILVMSYLGNHSVENS